MYILSTETCLLAMKNSSPALTEKLLSIHPDEIAVSSITIAEMEREISNGKWSRQTQLGVRLFLSSFQALPFTREDAEILGILMHQAYDLWILTGMFELMIAAQCIERKSTLILTHDSDLIRIPGILTENWT